MPLNSGPSAWTPQESTYFHFLTMELGKRYEIRSIATQGRSGTHEFVTEFIVQYSDDGDGWRSVTDSDGETEVLFN